MSYLPTRSVSIGDSANLDAFARLRVSNPTGLFNAQNEYDASPLLFATDFTGAGAVTHLPNESSVQLSTGSSSSGDKAIRQSKEYVRYQPGKSQQVLATFVFGAAATNARRRVGLFDDNNGVFLEQVSTGLRFVQRSYVSGSPVDTVVDRASWNIDPMDGTGPSGVTIDPTKAQIFVADLEWLGVGRVRVGFVVDGCICYAHEFLNTNTISSVYMTTANLPVRAEVENIGVTAGAVTMKFICCAVSSEGGFENDRGYPFGFANSGTITVGTSPTVMIALRPKATFGGKVNRGQLSVDNISIHTASDMVWQLVYNPTLTGGSWSDVSAGNSMAEVNTTCTISGGIVIQTGFLAGTVQFRAPISEAIKSRVPIVLGDVAGVTPISVALVGIAFTGSHAARGAVNWGELR